MSSMTKAEFCPISICHIVVSSGSTVAASCSQLSSATLLLCHTFDTDIAAERRRCATEESSAANYVYIHVRTRQSRYRPTSIAAAGRATTLIGAAPHGLTRALTGSTPLPCTCRRPTAASSVVNRVIGFDLSPSYARVRAPPLKSRLGSANVEASQNSTYLPAYKEFSPRVGFGQRDDHQTRCSCGLRSRKQIRIESIVFVTLSTVLFQKKFFLNSALHFVFLCLF